MTHFTKMHGCGNDYIYINAFGGASVDALEKRFAGISSETPALCDRRKGIGADGVILIAPPLSSANDGRMIMFNADGSRGAMCGNGIRCVGKFLYDNILPKSNCRCDVMLIETDSGVKRLIPHVQNARCSAVTVDMGSPVFSENPVPEHDFTIVDMGNPHAVLLVDNVKTAPVLELGEAMQSRFPGGVNVEFVHPLNRAEIDFRVYERGSGETFACGTGACAAAAALHRRGLTGSEVTVHLLGGDLRIVLEKSSVLMTGEAVTVFEGCF